MSPAVAWTRRTLASPGLRSGPREVQAGITTIGLMLGLAAMTTVTTTVRQLERTSIGGTTTTVPDSSKETA